MCSDNENTTRLAYVRPISTTSNFFSLPQHTYADEEEKAEAESKRNTQPTFATTAAERRIDIMAVARR
jgi:hypothetical protein